MPGAALSPGGCTGAPRGLRASAEFFFFFQREQGKARCVMYGRGQLSLRGASHSELRLEREASEVCGSQRGWGIKQAPPTPHLELGIAYVAAVPRGLYAQPGCPGKAPEARGRTWGHGHVHTHTHTHSSFPGGGRAGLGSPHPANSLEVEAARLAQLTARIIHTTKCSWGISALLGAASAGSPPCCWYFQHVPAPLQPLGEAVAGGCLAPCKPPHTPRALGTHLRTRVWGFP